MCTIKTFIIRLQYSIKKKELSILISRDFNRMRNNVPQYTSPMVPRAKHFKLPRQPAPSSAWQFVVIITETQNHRQWCIWGVNIFVLQHWLHFFKVSILFLQTGLWGKISCWEFPPYIIMESPRKHLWVKTSTQTSDRRLWPLYFCF